MKSATLRVHIRCGAVFLPWALACGLPIVASSLDASAEVVLNRSFGRLVTPDRPVELQAACVDLLAAQERARTVPRELRTFSLARFKARWNWLLSRCRLASWDVADADEGAGDYWGDGGGGYYGVEVPTPITNAVTVEQR